MGHDQLDRIEDKLDLILEVLCLKGIDGPDSTDPDRHARLVAATERLKATTAKLAEAVATVPPAP
jgi:hypothetical protein